MVFFGASHRCSSSSSGSKSRWVFCVSCLLLVAAFQPQWALGDPSHSFSFSGDSGGSEEMHRVVVSEMPRMVDGEQQTRLEISLFRSVAPTEGEEQADEEPGQLPKGLLYASVEGSYAEVDSALLDGDYRSLATMLDAVLKEAEALGADAVWSSSCNSSISFLGHIFAGFRPQLEVGLYGPPEIIWTAEASAARRQQMKEQHKAFGVQVIWLAQASAAQEEELELFLQKHGKSLDSMSREDRDLCFFAMNHRGSIVQALVASGSQSRHAVPSVDFVGSAGMSMSVELLAGLKEAIVSGAVGEAVLPVSATDARKICIAVDAGFIPSSISKHEVVFMADQTDKQDHLFRYVIERRGEVWEKAGQKATETQEQEEEEGAEAAAHEAREAVRARWKWAVDEVMRQNLLAQKRVAEAPKVEVPVPSVPQQAAPEAPAAGAQDVSSLQGLGVGIAGALMVALLVISLNAKRRNPSRIKTHAVPMSFKLVEAEQPGEATQTEGVVVAVEAGPLVDGSERLS